MPAPDRKRRLTAFLVAMAVLIATPLAVVAADAFTDVPASNVFHEDIAWLAAAGVTKGCNPPANTEFCPSDNVTREQMSAFMRRLAQYMDAEDGTPALADHATTAGNAGDSDALNGQGPAAYRTIINADSCVFSGCTNSTGGVLSHASVEVTAPAAGVLEISGSFHGFGDGAGSDDFIQMWTAINETSNGGCGGWFFAPTQNAPGSYSAVTAPGSQAFNLSTTTAVAIPPGTHTVHLCTLSLQNTTSDAAVLTTVWSMEESGLAQTGAGSAGSTDADLSQLKAQFEGFDLSHIER